jgi:nucleotidyltransferase AbiEii toxin of type IV toxin-antitoxin system
MVALGSANSRMKDFYDVWICSRHLDFNAATLPRAIEATFKNRDIALPDGEFEALTTGFVEGHRVEWNAFVKKIGESELTDRFHHVVEGLRNFAVPLLRLLAHDKKVTRQWRAGKGWVGRS